MITVPVMATVNCTRVWNSRDSPGSMASSDGRWWGDEGGFPEITADMPEVGPVVVMDKFELDVESAVGEVPTRGPLAETGDGADRQGENHSSPGLSADKIARMHGIATAAQRGILDAERLRALGPDIALQEAQHLKGIGPFYASLITIRAVGFTDVLPRDEPIIRELVTRLYRLPSLCTPERFEEIAEPWRPYRTWASVLVRAAAGRRSGSPAQLAS